MEYTIYCLACGSHRSEGQLEATPAFRAADVLALALHNPGCTLSDPKRSAPSVTQQQQGSVIVYTITPGAFVDAVLVLD